MIGASTRLIHIVAGGSAAVPTPSIVPKGLTGRTAAQARTVSADRPSSEEKAGVCACLGQTAAAMGSI